MKRLAMGFESPVSAELPSYLQWLTHSGGRFHHVSAPRWWIAVADRPVSRGSDGLAWNLTELSLRVMTEDGYLTSSGRLKEVARSNSLATRWALAMTDEYEALSSEYAVFGQLRGCLDLAVAAAVIDHERLEERTGCDLSLLLDRRSLRGLEYHVPRTVDSKASLVRTRRGWIVSISGGVDLDAWRVLREMPIDPELADVRRDLVPPTSTEWWWQSR